MNLLMLRTIIAQNFRITSETCCGQPHISCGVKLFSNYDYLLATHRHAAQSVLRRYQQVLRPSQAKVLTEGGDLREALFDVPPSGSHTCV